MKCPLFSLLFLLVFLISCNEKDYNPITQQRNDCAAQFFEKSKETKDVNAKLSLLDNALAEISTPDDTLKAIIYDNLIYYYNVLKETDSAIYYSDLLIDHGFETEDTLQIANGFYRRGRSFLYKEEHINVLRDMYQSQKYYLLGGDSINAAKRLVELGIAQKRLGDFTGSQSSQVKALEIFGNSLDSVFMASIHNNLATSYRQLDDFDEAIDEYLNSLRYVQSRKDSVTILNNIANSYAAKEDYKKSLELYASILPLAEKTSSLNRIRDNYYFTQWLRDKADVADSLESIMEARSKDNDLTGLLASYDHLVRVNEEDFPSKALKYATKYYETAQKLHNVSDEISALDYLVRLSPYEEGKTYALEYIRINDSLMRARDKVKNIFAKIKYDEERKLAEIDQLEKTGTQQQLEVLRGRNQRNIAILLGILFLGSAAAVYFSIKQRHKKERISGIHATEARISKKIHDELANDVYNVMTELENPTSLKKEAILNKLESIYLTTRNISRENTPINTGSDFSEDLQYMLSQSVSTKAKLYLLGFHEIPWSNISQESKIVIHRVLQELMVNMRKHSEASIVSLHFKETSSKLKMIYNDNGKGFSSSEFKKGAGLKNVENRIETIGGSINFQPEKSTGFSVQILIPF